MKLKVKKLSANAVIPSYAKPGDAGMDLTATTKALIQRTEGDHRREGFKLVFGTGIAVEIPAGYVGLIFPRSSIHKKANRLSNCVGVIDSGYRGEIKFVFDLTSQEGTYEIGDRIGQLVLIELPAVEVEEVDKLSESERGVGGFGSTGA